jgi:hypothetical protein
VLERHRGTLASTPGPLGQRRVRMFGQGGCHVVRTPTVWPSQVDSLVWDDQDCHVKAIYSGDGDPEAVPGVQPKREGETDAPSLTLEVDGEVFALRQDQQGGTDYTWVSGPNPGYGFSLSPTRDMSLDEHRANIRDFLAMVDSTTGFIEAD